MATTNLAARQAARLRPIDIGREQPSAKIRFALFKILLVFDVVRAVNHGNAVPAGKQSAVNRRQAVIDKQSRQNDPV